MRVKKQSESDLSHSIIDYLVLNKYLVIRFNSGAIKIDKRFFRFWTAWCKEYGRITTGLSDIIAMKNGNIIWLEAKSEKGIWSDEQKFFKKIVESYGFKYLLVRSLDELMEVL